MLQGEFIERVFAGALSEQDIKDYINSQKKKDLSVFLKYIYDKQGGLLAEGMLRDERGRPLNPQWREQFQKLQEAAKLLEAKIGKKNKQGELPEILDTQLFNKYMLQAEKAKLVNNNQWSSPTKCAKFVVLMNKIPEAIKGHRYNNDSFILKPFEDYFKQANLAQYISSCSLKHWSSEDLEKDLFG